MEILADRNQQRPVLICKIFSAKEINVQLMDLFSKDVDVELDAVVEVLLKHIKHENRATRMAVLNWIRHLHVQAPSKVSIS